jgi:hypothetical protein
MYHKTVYFVKYLFFLFFFFSAKQAEKSQKNKNTSPDIQSLRCKHIMHNKHEKSLHRFEKTPYKLTVLLTHVIERIDKLKSFLFFTASNLLTNRSQAQRRL